MQKQEYKQILTPHLDVLVFMLTLLISNWVWKYSVWGEESGVGEVTLWGLVVLTDVFNAYAAHITDAVYAIVSSMRDTIYQVDAFTLRWMSGSGTRIVWSCTPLKQSFIWICLLLTTPGWVPKGTERMQKTESILKRVAWIAAGLLVIYGFNILRISIITLFMEHHAEWFEVLHNHIFKYIFYGIMFLMWVVYVEVIRPRKA